MTEHALPTILVTEHLHPDAVTRLQRHGRVVQVNPDDTPAIAAVLPTADALVVRTYTTVDAALLDRAPRLRVVGRAGVGLDAIDVAACRARGVAVVHTPDANTMAVVSWVLATVLGHLRPLPRVPSTGVDAAGWRRLRDEAMALRSPESMTVGVVGFGRVGSRVAAAFSALGSRVLAHDLREIDRETTDRFGARLAPIETIHAEADVLTLHVDGRPANRGLYGDDRLEHLRQDVVLVNASRGLVVDPEALARFLDRRAAAVAILDVHDPEPVPSGHPLLGHPRAILTPHVASRTEAAQRAMSDVVDDVLAVLAGKAPRCPAPKPGHELSG